MKLKELLKKYTCKQVISRIRKEYPRKKTHCNISVSGYTKVYEKLLNIRNTKKSKLKIVVKKVTVDFAGKPEEPWTDIHAVTVDGKKLYENDRVDENGNTLESYAIEFTPWREWLEMEIDESSFKDYDELSVLAHCLWEMTFCGFEEKEVKDEIIELKHRTDELKKWEKEGTLDQHTFTWEQVKQNLNAKFGIKMEDKDDEGDKGNKS